MATDDAALGGVLFDHDATNHRTDLKLNNTKALRLERSRCVIPSGTELDVESGATLTMDGTFAVPGPLTQTVKVTLTNAQIINLAATQVSLVAAQGASTMIELVQAVFVLNYGGTNAFTESTNNLIINYVDDSGVAASASLEGTGFLDGTADIHSVVPGIAVVNGTAAQVVNTALIVDNPGAGEIAGNAGEDNTIDVFVTYRVHSIS